MTLSRRTLLSGLAATPFVSLLPRSARAAYPDKPVRLIVPFAAGGNADLVARIVAEGIQPLIGQPVVVETRAGGGGSIGAAYVAAAEADGYTLLVGSNGPLTVNPFVQAKLGYDPIKDFTPISLASVTPHSLVVNDQLGVKTVPELVALSKKQPINIGTSGVGSASHMTLARFMAATGANITHVPYRGGGALVGDVLAGTVSGAMTEMSTLLQHHGKGKVHILAISWPKRSALLTEVPTMDEQGVKDFTAASYVGVLAPAKTPAEAIKKIEEAMVKALADKAIQAKFQTVGGEMAPDAQDSKGFAAYIKSEFDNSKKAAEVAGLKPE